MGISRDVANTGVGGQRPNRIASSKLDHPTLERWFDAGAFATPAMLTYGNAGLRIPSPGTVGRVTSTSTEPRQMQMAVKYNF